MTQKTRKQSHLTHIAVAIEPASKRSESFEIFAEFIRHFQKNGILPTASIVSVIHPALFMVPGTWFYENIRGYASEAKLNVIKIYSGLFDFRNIHIVKSDSSNTQLLVDQLSTYLNRSHSELLVVLSNNRTGLANWLLGSFAEATVLTSPIPVMVIKPQVKQLQFAARPRLVIAVDAATSYSHQQVQWISGFALQAKAVVDLIYVKSNPQGLVSSIRAPKHHTIAMRELQKLEKHLIQAGIEAKLTTIKEKDSVAQSLSDYADKKRAWMVMTISTPRKLSRRLLLGSTERKILSLTQRPYICLRHHET